MPPNNKLILIPFPTSSSTPTCEPRSPFLATLQQSHPDTDDEGNDDKQQNTRHILSLSVLDDEDNDIQEHVHLIVRLIPHTDSHDLLTGNTLLISELGHSPGETFTAEESSYVLYVSHNRSPGGPNMTIHGIIRVDDLYDIPWSVDLKCTSVRVDAPELIFMDLATNSKTVRELTIINSSESEECDALYSLDLSNEDNVVLTYFDNGAPVPLRTVLSIKPKGRVRFNVSLTWRGDATTTTTTAAAAADAYCILVENTRNPFQNFFSIPLRVLSSLSMPKDTTGGGSGGGSALLASTPRTRDSDIPFEIIPLNAVGTTTTSAGGPNSPDQITFDDCFCNETATAVIILRARTGGSANSVRTPLHVKLSCPDSSQVTFSPIHNTSGVRGGGGFNSISDSLFQFGHGSTHMSGTGNDDDSGLAPPTSASVVHDIANNEESDRSLVVVLDDDEEDSFEQLILSSSSARRRSSSQSIGPSFGGFSEQEKELIVALGPPPHHPMEKRVLITFSAPPPLQDNPGALRVSKFKIVATLLPPQPFDHMYQQGSGGGSTPTQHALIATPPQESTMPISPSSVTLLPLIRTLPAQVRFCASVLKMRPTDVKFQHVIVGEKRGAQVIVENMSDLPARFSIKVICISSPRDPHSTLVFVDGPVRNAMLEPRMSVALDFSFTPKVAENLRFELRLVNSSVVGATTMTSTTSALATSQPICTVQATVVDPNDISIHSLFYKLMSFPASSTQQQSTTITSSNTSSIPSLPTPIAPPPPPPPLVSDASLLFDRIIFKDSMSVQRIKLQSRVKTHNIVFRLEALHPDLNLFTVETGLESDLAALCDPFELFSMGKPNMMTTSFLLSSPRPHTMKSTAGTAGAAGNDGNVLTLGLSNGGGGGRPMPGERLTERQLVELAETRLRDWDRAVQSGFLKCHTSGQISITLTPESSFHVALVFSPMVEYELPQHVTLRVHIVDVGLPFKLDDNDGVPSPTNTTTAAVTTNSTSSSDAIASILKDVLQHAHWLSTDDKAKILGGEIPYRDYSCMVTACPRSKLRLEQTHFNFGVISHAWESKKASIVLHNDTPCPILYRLQSTSPGSGVELSEDQTTGVVLPLGSKTVSLEFVPHTWRGRIEEIVHITHILSKNTETDIIFKAIVNIPEHFAVREHRLNFGACFPGKTTGQPVTLTLINTSEKSRELIVKAMRDGGERWPKGHVAVFCFHVWDPTPEELANNPGASDRIESLEHKMRIAARKGNTDKLAAMERKMKLVGVLSPRHAISMNDSTTPTATLQQQQPLSAHHARGTLQGATTVTLPVRSAVRVSIWLHVRKLQTNLQEVFTGRAEHTGLCIFEKNKGEWVVKSVPFECWIYPPESSNMPHNNGPLSAYDGAHVMVNDHPTTSSSSSIANPHPRRPTTPLRSSSGQGVAFSRVRAMTSYASTMVKSIQHTIGRSTSLLTPSTSSLEVMPSVARGGSAMDDPNNNNITLPRVPSIKTTRTSSTESLFSGTKSPDSGESARYDTTLPMTSSPTITSKSRLSSFGGFVRSSFTGGNSSSSAAVTATNPDTPHSNSGDEAPLPKLLPPPPPPPPMILGPAAAFLRVIPESLDLGDLIITTPLDQHNRNFVPSSPCVGDFSILAKNIHYEAVLISAKANTAQMEVVGDATQEIERVFVESGAELTIHLRVKPVVLAQAWRGICRSFTGAVAVTADSVSTDQTFEVLVPFSAVVGLGLFSATQHIAPGVIRISNLTDRIMSMRLAFDAEAPTKLVTTADPPCDEVVFEGLDDGEHLILAKREAHIKAYLRHSPEKGLTYRDVRIRNLSSGETISIDVALLSTSRGMGVLAIERGISLAVAVPLSDTNEVARDALADEHVRVRNTSSNKVHLVVRCGFHPPLKDGDVIIQPPSVTTSDALRVCTYTSPTELTTRAEGMLDPGAYMDVMLRFTAGAKLKAGSFKGWVGFAPLGRDSVESVAVRFEGHAAKSKFEVNKKRIDLGEIRSWDHSSMTTAHEVCRVFNVSPMIPAEVRVFVSDVPAAALRVEVETVTAFLKPKTAFTDVSHPIMLNVDTIPGIVMENGEYDFMLHLVNDLSPSSNTYRIPVKVHVLSIPFSIRPRPHGGGESTSSSSDPTSSSIIHSTIIHLPDMYLRRFGGNQAESEIWLSVTNSSSQAELELICSTTCAVLGEGVSLTLWNNDKEICHTLIISPGGTSDIRVCMSCPAGCAIRSVNGEDVLWGTLLLSCGAGGGGVPYEFAVVGQATGETLLGLCDAAYQEFSPDQVFDLNATGVYRSVILYNHSNVDVDVMTEVVPDGDMFHVLMEQSVIPVGGRSRIKLIPTRKSGASRIDFHLGNHGNMIACTLNVRVGFPPVSPELRKFTSIHDTGIRDVIKGCDFVEEGLYKLDLGVLTEETVVTLTSPIFGPSAGNDRPPTVHLIKLADGGEWITLTRRFDDGVSGSEPSVTVRFTPQPGEYGYFCAYLWCRVIIKIEIEILVSDAQPSYAMVKDDVMEQQQQQSGTKLLENSEDGNTVVSTMSHRSDLFSAYPLEIVTGNLYEGRSKTFSFSIQNHTADEMVFQCQISPATQPGLAVWISDSMLLEDHRRVTVPAKSITRVSVWFKPNIGFDPDRMPEFTNVEIGVACRHVKDVRTTILFKLPLRPHKPAFSVVTKPGTGESGSMMMTLQPHFLTGIYVVMPPWMKVDGGVARQLLFDNDGPNTSMRRTAVTTTTTTNTGLVRIMHNEITPLSIQVIGHGRVVFYNKDDMEDFVEVWNTFWEPRAPSMERSASVWRDGIETEICRGLVFGIDACCPLHIIAHELITLMVNDVGGRGPSLAKLWYFLCNVDPTADSNSLLRAMFVRRIKVDTTCIGGGFTNVLLRNLNQVVGKF